MHKRKRIADIIGQTVSAMEEKPSFFADELFGIPEAARRLGGLSHSTIRSWIQLGKIKAVWVGDRRMIRASELAKMVRE